MDESTRKCLQDAADKNARSLSQEAEHRLMTSFGDVARGMFTFADTLRTVRTVSGLAGMSAINREAFVKSCRAGLVGLIDNLIAEPVK